MSLKQPSKRTVAPKCNIPTNTLSDRARSGKVLKVTRDGSVVGGGEGKNGGKGPGRRWAMPAGNGAAGTPRSTAGPGTPAAAKPPARALRSAAEATLQRGARRFLKT